MTNALPSEPSKPKPQNPQVGDTWFDEDNELLAWDGSDWVLYEDLPLWPGGDDPKPNGLLRES